MRQCPYDRDAGAFSLDMVRSCTIFPSVHGYGSWSGPGGGDTIGWELGACLGQERCALSVLGMTMRAITRLIGVAGCLMLLCASHGWAARRYTPVHPDPVLESWRWTRFPELNGLGLRCMAESTDGAMWFGVDDGVIRYDGVHWRPFTAEDGIRGVPVNVLCASRDGSVYAASD